MNKVLLGGLAALLMVGLGMFWWQGRAEVEEAAPPPEPVQTGDAPSKDELPTADVGSMRGPKPPEATELSREQRRFFRYDRNRDQWISRNEMLSTRTTSFRKLDKDGNNLLTFEEWAVTTVKKFDGADKNGDRKLSAGEFLTTRPKPRATRRRSCRC